MGLKAADMDEEFFLLLGLCSYGNRSEIDNATPTEITLDDIERIMSKYEKKERIGQSTQSVEEG